MDIALKRLLMNYYYTHRSIHCLTLIKDTYIHSRQKLTPKPNKVQRIKSLNLKWHIYIVSFLSKSQKLHQERMVERLYEPKTEDGHKETVFHT